MRRVLPILLVIGCLGGLSGIAWGWAAPGARSERPHATLLAGSFTDGRGTAYLKFEVSGVAKGQLISAHLILHRSAARRAASVAVTTIPDLAHVTAMGSAAPANPVDVDVSELVRGDGPIKFVVSPQTQPAASASPVVYVRDAGTEAPLLVVTGDPSGVAATGGDDPAATTDSPSATDVSASSSSLSSAAASASSSSLSSSAAASSLSSSPTGDPTGIPTDSTSPADAGLPVSLVPVPSGLAPSPSPTSPTSVAPGCTVSSILVPSCGAWWGVGVNPLGSESWDQALTNYEAAQGRSSDVLHYYHVGAGTFPTALEIARSQEGGSNRLLLENWKPELGRSWAQVAAGDPVVDAEIDHEAAYLKAQYTSRFFLAIHHEPENEVIPAAGSGYTALDYAAMYRHVVLRLRADGVTNAVFVLDYMGIPRWGEQSWFTDLYPGDDVVDWIAEDPYSEGVSAPWRTDFAGMVDRRDGSFWPGFYTWATTVHPGKPIMLAEWGVTDDPADPAAKAAFFQSQLAEEAHYPAIKALVYWNAPGFAALVGGATRIDSDPAALAAFQQLAASSEFHSPLP